MSEKRFPNAEEIAALKAKGVVAVSNTGCRLGAALCLIFFLLKANIPEHFRGLLSASDISDPILAESVISLLQSLLFAVLLYLVIFAVMAMLQSRFYFNIGQVFRRKNSFIDLSRGFSFFKISSLFLSIGILLGLGVSLTIWREFFFSSLGLLQGSNIATLSEALKTASLKLVNFIFGIILVLIVLAVVYSKINFRFSHRTIDKRGR